MLELPDSWVWDSWTADDGDRFHQFFLFASRALIDPERRHRRASIGHAVSRDLRTWTRLPDALVRADAPAIDDVATWTGCTVRGDDGRWYLFYTALSDRPVSKTQRVALAVSDDLLEWTRMPSVVVEADPRWYASGATGPEEPFRDPWVWKHDDGRWHMLVTASAPGVPAGDQGVVGHAVSDDLLTWTVQPPLVGAGHGFGQLEVSQGLKLEGRWYLLFSCLPHELAPSRRAAAGDCGIWAARMAGPLGPVEIEDARVLTDGTRYAARAVRDRDGEWMLLPFENASDHGFVGRVADPLPLRPLIEAAFSRQAVAR